MATTTRKSDYLAHRYKMGLRNLCYLTQNMTILEREEFEESVRQILKNNIIAQCIFAGAAEVLEEFKDSWA